MRGYTTDLFLHSYINESMLPDKKKDKRVRIYRRKLRKKIRIRKARMKMTLIRCAHIDGPPPSFDT